MSKFDAVIELDAKYCPRYFTSLMFDHKNAGKRKVGYKNLEDSMVQKSMIDYVRFFDPVAKYIEEMQV